MSLVHRNGVPLHYFDFTDELFPFYNSEAAGTPPFPGAFGDRKIGYVSSVLPGPLLDTYVSSPSKHPGIVQIYFITGGVVGTIYIGGIVARGPVSSTNIHLDDIDYVGFIVRPSNNTGEKFDASTILRMGVGTDITSSTFGTDGFWFEYNGGVSSNWRIVSRSSSSSTTTTTGLALTAGNWYQFEMERTPTALRFYINETLYATHSTIPSAMVTAPMIVLSTSSVASNTPRLDLDWLRVAGQIKTARY